MAFDIRGFYDRLDQYYAGYDNAATEQFLKDSLAEAESFMIVPSHCCSCDDHMDHTPEEQVEAMSDEERQWILECSDARVAVLNEMACFYRGISEFDKCLTCFRAVEEELQARGMENNSTYAVVELNMAGALRLMGRLDEALDTFRKAEAVLLASPNTDDYELAGLYNNTGLVYQDMEKLEASMEKSAFTASAAALAVSLPSAKTGASNLFILRMSVKIPSSSSKNSMPVSEMVTLGTPISTTEISITMPSIST